MAKHIGAQMLEFSQNGDERGWLVVIEGGSEIPFDIARIFYIYGSTSVLLCLSSEHYDANEYIRNYDEFLKIVDEEHL